MSFIDHHLGIAMLALHKMNDKVGSALRHTTPVMKALLNMCKNPWKGVGTLHC